MAVVIATPAPECRARAHSLVSGVSAGADLFGDVLPGPRSEALFGRVSPRARAFGEAADDGAATMSGERIALGSWTLPSGNSCDAFLCPDLAGAGVMVLSLEWDAPPPFDVMDSVFYVGRVLPAIHRRIAEWKETPVGPALVVLAEEPR